jgi:hypothetical protein
VVDAFQRGSGGRPGLTIGIDDPEELTEHLRENMLPELRELVARFSETAAA